MVSHRAVCTTCCCCSSGAPIFAAQQCLSCPYSYLFALLLVSCCSFKVGFNMRKVTKGGVTIKMWDLGGQVSWAVSVMAALSVCAQDDIQSMQHSLQCGLYNNSSTPACLHATACNLPALFASCLSTVCLPLLLLLLCRHVSAAPLPQLMGALLPRRASDCVCCGCSRP